MVIRLVVAATVVAAVGTAASAGSFLLNPTLQGGVQFTTPGVVTNEGTGRVRWHQTATDLLSIKYPSPNTGAGVNIPGMQGTNGGKIEGTFRLSYNSVTKELTSTLTNIVVTPFGQAGTAYAGPFSHTVVTGGNAFNVLHFSAQPQSGMTAGNVTFSPITYDIPGATLPSGYAFTTGVPGVNKNDYLYAPNMSFGGITSFWIEGYLTLERVVGGANERPAFNLTFGNADAQVVPLPTTGGLAGLGLLALGARRRRIA